MKGPLILDGVKPKEKQTDPQKKNSVTQRSGEVTNMSRTRDISGNHHQEPADVDIRHLLGNLDKHLSSISNDMSAIRQYIDLRQADL